LVGFVVLAMATGAFFVWALPGVAGLMVGTESQVSGTAHNWVARNTADQHCTTSSTFQTLFDGELTFHTTGFHKRALIFFQSAWSKESGLGNPEVELMALIDGDPVDIGSEEEVDAAGITPLVQEEETHGFNWISEELHPGTHTVEIQFAETNSTLDACAEERSIIVQIP
jgi:hypothetical protein